MMIFSLSVVTASLLAASPVADFPECDGCGATGITTTTTKVIPGVGTISISVTGTAGSCFGTLTAGQFSCESEPCTFEVTRRWAGLAPGTKVTGWWGRYRPDDPSLRERNGTLETSVLPTTLGADSETLTEADGITCQPLPLYFSIEVGDAEHSAEATDSCSACETVAE